MKKNWKIWTLPAAAALIVLAAGIAMNALRYEASEAARFQMTEGAAHGRHTAFEPESIRAGLVFYPGGMVEHEAYAPLMQALCRRGVLCILVGMPMDLAVLDADAAEGIQEKYPQVERWMIGGHSLGGAMAAAYAADHPQEFDALLLLGAYSAEDLRHTDLAVLSVYGTHDGVLNRSKYEECKAHYPEAFEEFVIEGGCHAYFGDYGGQKGDGKPTISREMQMGVTASAVSAWMDTW